MTKLFTPFVILFTILATFAYVLVLPASATPIATWDTTGNYVVALEYNGDYYSHDMTLVQDAIGNLTGSGGSPAGDNTYLWTINSGTVVDNTIQFTANYTATADAVTPQTTITVMGAIAPNGSMSGTWSDNYQAGNRSGSWTTTTGTATYGTTDPVVSSSTVKVTIEKFIQGSPATAASANNADFPMMSSWNASNTGAGAGTYTLSETNTIPYQAVTAAMSKGADYSTKEKVNGNTVGAQCATGKPFALTGYTTGNTRAEAIAATPSMAQPSFTNLQTDKYVIVWNRDCTLPAAGQIAGDVVGNDGVLEVTSIEMINTTATANGTFTDGWKYVFHITVPTSEPKLAMKFDNWLRTGGNGTIPVGSNMRISSLQADNGGAAIVLAAPNTYSAPDFNLTGDLDPTTAGRQIKVTVEVAVPVGTPNGTYTTAYGVRSNP